MDTKLPKFKKESLKDTFDLSEYQKKISRKIENILTDKTLSTSFFLPSTSLFEPFLIFSPIKINYQIFNVGIFYNSQSMNYILDQSAAKSSSVEDSKDLYCHLMLDTIEMQVDTFSHGTIVDIPSHHFEALSNTFIEKPHFWVLSSTKFSFTFFLGKILSIERSKDG